MKDKDRLHPIPELGPALMLVIARLGTRLVALRCTGFNNGDLAAARSFGIEHKIHRACNRVRKPNIPSVGGMLVNILVGIFMVPCAFCAVEEWKWKRRAGINASPSSP